MRRNYNSRLFNLNRVRIMIRRAEVVRRFLFCTFGALVLIASSIFIALPASAIQIVHTVTFMENVNVADQVTQLQLGSAPAALTRFTELSPTFTDPGYTFTGWNSSADGTGTSFTDGETYSFANDTGMYAQWQLIPISHSVTFFENASASDTLSTFMTASQPTQLTSFTNIQPAFQKTGSSFTEWNTAADGSGTPYANGSLCPFNNDIGLYAQWTVLVVSHVVTFRQNSSALDAVTTTQTMSAPSTLTLFANTQPTFVNLGDTFTGWNTAADGSGISYANGASFGFASDMTLFAQWSQTVPSSIQITLNEGVNGTPSISGVLGSTIVLPILDASLDPGFAFGGWNTAADGSGIAYSGGASFVLRGDTTLFAQWIPRTPALLAITFNANGGSGSINSMTGVNGSLVTLPSHSGLIRSGFAMTSWNSQSNGRGISYSGGQVIALTKSITLYAQWKGHLPASLFGAVGAFKKNSSVLSLALKAQINRIASTIRAKKYLTVTLYGYTATTGLASLNMTLSRARAQHVAQFLRLRLTALRVKGVSIRSAGEGAIAGESSSAYSRVEVFGV